MPLEPKNTIAEIVRQHPHIPDDQLLEEAKRVFSQYKGVKVGTTVTMEDVEAFKKTQGKKASSSTAKRKKFKVIEEVFNLAGQPSPSDDELAKRANVLRLMVPEGAKPKSAAITEEDVEEMTKRFLESRRQDSQAAKVVVNWEVLAHELGRAVVNAERGIKLVMETKDKPEENASLLQALHEVLVVGKQFYTKANGNP